MTAKKFTLEEINALDKAGFSSTFENVIEKCTEAGDFVYSRKPFASLDGVKSTFYEYLDALDTDKLVGIFNNHPVLGTKEKITDDSVKEQTSAGLRSLSKDKDNDLVSLNQKYFAKFGFPFIVCVKTRSQDEVFTEINRRLLNRVEQEVSNACHEVKQIIYYRLKDIVKE